MNKLAVLFTLLSVLSTFPLVSSESKERPNIIVMIGDGMGPAYMTAYRRYLDNLQTPEVEPTSFDSFLVGTAKTDPHDHEHYTITDSAAAATAIATGHKTYYKAVSVDKSDKPLKTSMEKARELGYQTGVVVLSTVVHATPASFAAHDPSRKNYEGLADQYFDTRINGKPVLDIIFGGGQKHLIREDRNLLQEFEEIGYQSAVNWEQFDKINSKPALALLDNEGLLYEIDSPEKYRLTRMTKKALSIMDDKPFYLLVEGSQIDWCGHANDIACAMEEMKDFEATLDVILNYIKDKPNTLLILTADHSTGGLSLGANYEFIYDGPTKKYAWFPEPIRKIKRSIKKIARTLFYAQNDWYNQWLDLTSMELTRLEQQEFAKLIVGYTIEPDISIDDLKENHRLQLRALLITMLKVINGRTNTGWTTGGHTSVDVNVYSYGKYSHLFKGNIDNTKIGKVLFDVLD